MVSNEPQHKKGRSTLNSQLTRILKTFMRVMPNPAPPSAAPAAATLIPDVASLGPPASRAQLAPLPPAAAPVAPLPPVATSSSGGGTSSSCSAAQLSAGSHTRMQPSFGEEAEPTNGKFTLPGLEEERSQREAAEQQMQALLSGRQGGSSTPRKSTMAAQDAYRRIAQVSRPGASSRRWT